MPYTLLWPPVCFLNIFGFCSNLNPLFIIIFFSDFSFLSNKFSSIYEFVSGFKLIWLHLEWYYLSILSTLNFVCLYSFSFFLRWALKVSTSVILNMIWFLIEFEFQLWCRFVFNCLISYSICFIYKSLLNISFSIVLSWSIELLSLA